MDGARSVLRKEFVFSSRAALLQYPAAPTERGWRALDRAINYSRDGDDASVMILPGFYRDRDKDHIYTNLLLAASYESDEAGYDSAALFPVFSHQSNQGDAGYDSHFYAFPFYYGREGYNRAISLHILPAIYSEYTPAPLASNDQTGDFKLFAAGLYVPSLAGLPARQPAVSDRSQAGRNDRQRRPQQLRPALPQQELRKRTRCASLRHGLRILGPVFPASAIRTRLETPAHSRPICSG